MGGIEETHLISSDLCRCRGDTALAREGWHHLHTDEDVLIEQEVVGVITLAMNHL